MNRRSLKLSEFIAEYRFWDEWEVSYTDGTHLKKSEYVKLGNISIDGNEESAQDHLILPFTFKPVTSREIECSFSKLSVEKEQVHRAKEAISSQLADSMIRTGLLRPEFCMMEDRIFKMEFREVMKRLSEHHYLILVVDTSALRRGVTSFLHNTLSKFSHIPYSNVLIWTVVPVFVMTEVQRQAKDLSDKWVKSSRGTQPHLGKCDILSQRPQVTCISRELNHIYQWRPLEIFTTLSEHFGQSNGKSSIDRLIIESTKNLKRDRGLQQGVFLLTGDKDMASLATLENLDSLHIDVPRPPTEVSSIRYDSHNERIVLTPIHYLLWDLAQVFSTIRLVNKEQSRTYKILYYSESRGGFFAHDVMEICED